MDSSLGFAAVSKRRKWARLSSQRTLGVRTPIFLHFIFFFLFFSSFFTPHAQPRRFAVLPSPLRTFLSSNSIGCEDAGHFDPGHGFELPVAVLSPAQLPAACLALTPLFLFQLPPYLISSFHCTPFLSHVVNSTCRILFSFPPLSPQLPSITIHPFSPATSLQTPARHPSPPLPLPISGPGVLIAFPGLRTVQIPQTPPASRTTRQLGPPTAYCKRYVRVPRHWPRELAMAEWHTETSFCIRLSLPSRTE